MLLNLISEIDPTDGTMKELEILASHFGIFNMTIAVTKTKELKPTQSGKVAFFFDESNYRDIVSQLISVAVMNYASAKHEMFMVPVTSELAEKYTRTVTADQHRQTAEVFLLQAVELIRRFQPS